MHICLVADDNYAPYLLAVLRSILRHKSSYAAKVTILTDALSVSHRDAVARLVDPFEITLAFVEVGEKLPPAYEAENSPIRSSTEAFEHLTKTAYGRLFAPEMIKERKAIYLDVDVCCISPLTALWGVELGESSALMVEACWRFYPQYKLRLGLAAEEPYFNTGVILMNLEKLRNIRFTQRALEIVHSRRTPLRFPDQDIFNILLRADIWPLHPRWNVGTGLFHWTPWQTVTYGEDVVRQAIDKPGIIHYTGNKKPWHQNCLHPYADEFRRFMG